MTANETRPGRGLPSLALALALLAPVPAAAEAPEQVLAAAAEAFATVVATRREELERDLGGAYALVDEYLLAHFDFETSCRLILREHWDSATATQRKRFVAALYRWLLASHGDALLAFRYDTITVVPATDAPLGPSARVRARLRLTDGRVFDVDFYMRRDDRGWRIVDVIAEGISSVRTFRTDFGAEIRATRLEALISRLEREAAPPGSESATP